MYLRVEKFELLKGKITTITKFQKVFRKWSKCQKEKIYSPRNQGQNGL